MHGCSTAISCTLEAWFQAHMFIFWCILGGAAIIFVVEILFLARGVRRSWQHAREDEQIREEQENEWKVFEHRTRSLTRQGEEWDVDTSDFKASTRRLTYMHKATIAIDRERTLLLFPLMPLTITIGLASWYPALWILVVLGVLFALSIIWWIYHGLKLRRYRWAYNVLKHIEANKAKH